MKNKLTIEYDFYFFLVLVILLPLHYVLFSLILGSVKALSLWREGIIIFLTIYSLKKTKIDLEIVHIVTISAVILLFAIFQISYGLSVFNIARVYIFPMLIYVYCKSARFSKEKLRILRNVVWIVGVFQVFYGLLQAFVLKEQFLINLGYAGSNGHMDSYSFYIQGNLNQQRMTGTFVGPNNCAAYLMCVAIILILAAGSVKRYRVLYYAGVGVILIGIVATFSRSAWVGVVAGLLLFNNWKGLKNAKVLISWIFLILFGIILGLGLDALLLHGRVSNMVFGHLINTISGNELSTMAHVENLYKPMSGVADKMFGLGFGTNGSLAAAYLDASRVHMVESSYYLMFFELGIVFGGVFFFSYVRVVFESIIRFDKLTICQRIAAKIGVSLLLVYLVLPSIQAYELPLIFFACLGVSRNASMSDIVCK